MKEEQYNPPSGVKLWTTTFIKLCIINIAFFMGFHMMTSTFSFYVLDLGGDEAIAGIAAGMFSAAAVLMRPIVGWMLDNKGRKIMLFFGAIGLIIFPLAYSVCTILTLIVILRFAHGAVWACCSTSTSTIAGDIVPQERFGEGIGFFGLTAAVATAIGPSIGLFLIEGVSFKALFLVASICAAIGLILLFSTKIKDAPPKEKKPFFKNLKSLLNPDAFPASLTIFCFMLSYGGIINFIALYSETNGLLSGGLYFAIMAVSSAVIRVFTGRVVDTRGEGIAVYSSNIFFAVALLILIIYPSNITYILSALLYGIAFGMMTPSMQSMAMHIAQPERRGAASSTYLSCVDLGIGFGGAISGILVKFFGYKYMFLAMLVFGLLGQKSSVLL